MDVSTSVICDCNDLKYYDIICIGAGAAGLYLGYKMVKEESPLSLLILEKLNKVGGRVQSVPFFDKSIKYRAEGCAQRFMDGQERVRDVVDFFNVGYTKLRNDLIATTDSASDLISQIVDKYDPDSPEIVEISNLDALVNTPTIETGSYENIREFANAHGYLTNINYMNLFYFYESVISTSLPTQNFINGGYINLFERMAEYINKRYEILLNTPVINVKYDHCRDLYIINNSYECKKLVYTGVVSDLSLINTDSCNLRSIKSELYENIGYYKDYIRIFFHFKNGWWTESQIPMQFKDLGPISVMYYYTLNDIVVYNGSINADLIHSLIPLELWEKGHNNIEWISISKAPRLKRFIKRYIKELVEKGATQSPQLGLRIPTEEELDSVTHFAFKYTKESVLTFGQMKKEKWKDFIQTINNYNNIHVVGGDYTYLTGWVEGAFESIDMNYENITNLPSNE